MKKAMVFLLMLVMLLGGCTAARPERHDGKLNVYITTYPLYDFTKKIAGDRINAVQIIPAGVEAHDYEPSPKLMAKLEKCDVFIFNGGGLEAWAERIDDSLADNGVVTVNTAGGIARDDDPHVWLSPLKAKGQAEKIYKALVKVDPVNAYYYFKNYAGLKKKFDRLDNDYKHTLSQVGSRDIVTTHAAFSYLCEDYGLKQVSISGISPDSEPSPKRMAEIIDFIKKNNIKYVFFEPLTSPKLADSIAEETGIEKKTLDPLEGLTPRQKAGGEDYFSIMDENLDSLRRELVR